MDNLRNYIALCWLEGNPLDLPRSYRFLKQNLLFYYFVELFVQYNMVNDFLDALVDVTEETLLTISFVLFTLALNKSLNKFVQVTSAVLVCKNVMACVALPVVALLTMTGSIFSYVLLALIVVWALYVISYIFRQVLNINHTASIVVGIIYFIVSYLGVYCLNLLINL